MDSLKMFKGYGKVEDDQHLEDQQRQQQPPHPKTSTPLIATISIFAILFLTLTLTLAFALAVLIHHTNTESPEEPPNSAATSTIRAVCNVTRFPNSCFSSISSSFHQNPTDPEAILKLSLRVSLTELSNLASSLRAMNGPALADCKDHMDDALSRLNDSLSAMMEAAPGGGRVLTDAKIGDIQTWVSAGLTDQQTCLDGLEEMGSGDVGAVKSKMQRSSEYTSNSLAIVANIRTLLEQFHMPLH